MKPLLRNYAGLLAGCAALLILETGCKGLGDVFSSNRYSDTAYQAGKSVQEKSLALIDKAQERVAYATVEKEDAALMQQFDSAIAAEQKRPKNQPTVEQWRTAKNEMRRFLDLWKKKEKLSPAFVSQEKKQVAKTFDALLKTEQAKRHS